MGRATRVILTKGRVYIDKGKYIQLRVFAKELVVLDMLTRSFGGNYYPHGSGYVWVVSKLSDLENIARQVNLPELAYALERGLK